MKIPVLASMTIIFGLNGALAFADPELVRQNLFVSAITSESRKFVEFTVENLNNFDVKCRFISVQAQYVDAETSRDLGFRAVILRDLVIKAEDRATSVESGKDIILELGLAYPNAEIKSLNNSDSDVRFSCDHLTPKQILGEKVLSIRDEFSASSARIDGSFLQVSTTFRHSGNVLYRLNLDTMAISEERTPYMQDLVIRKASKGDELYGELAGYLKRNVAALSESSPEGLSLYLYLESIL